LDFIRSRPGGASTEEIAEGLKIQPRCAAKIIRELELAGEVFRCSGRWMNTDAALEFSPDWDGPNGATGVRIDPAPRPFKTRP